MEYNPSSTAIQSMWGATQDLFRDRSLVLAIGEPLTLATFSLLPAIRKSSVGNYTTMNEALVTCQAKQPDLLICTDELAQGGGIDLIQKVRDISPNTNSLIFLKRETQEVVRDAINAHASGVVFQSSIGLGKDGDFIKALLSASEGRSYYPAEVREKAGYELKPLPDFSEKEMEVLRQLCQGLSNKDIATTLMVSPETVKTHVSNIISKFGVKDRTAAVVTALRAGL